MHTFALAQITINTRIKLHRFLSIAKTLSASTYTYFTFCFVCTPDADSFFFHVSYHKCSSVTLSLTVTKGENVQKMFLVWYIITRPAQLSLLCAVTSHVLSCPSRRPSSTRRELKWKKKSIQWINNADNFNKVLSTLTFWKEKYTNTQLCMQGKFKYITINCKLSIYNLKLYKSNTHALPFVINQYTNSLESNCFHRLF